MITRAEFIEGTDQKRVRVWSTEAAAAGFGDGTYEMDYPVGLERVEVSDGCDPALDVARVVFTDGSSVVLEVAHLKAVSLDGVLK